MTTSLVSSLAQNGSVPVHNSAGILHQSRPCRVRQRDETGFPEFTLPNREDPVVEIHVGFIQGQSLPWAEAGSREKPDESCIGQRPEARWRSKPGGLFHQSANLLGAEDM